MLLCWFGLMGAGRVVLWWSVLSKRLDIKPSSLLIVEVCSLAMKLLILFHPYFISLTVNISLFNSFKTLMCNFQKINT